MLKDEEYKYLVHDDSGASTKTYKEYTGNDEEAETQQEKELDRKMREKYGY